MCFYYLFLSLTQIIDISIILFRRILELGSGTGLLGLVTCCSANPASYTFTDCDENVLKLLKQNVSMNIGKLHENEPTWLYIEPYSVVMIAMKMEFKTVSSRYVWF